MAIFIGRETTTRILPTKIKFFFLGSARLTIIILLDSQQQRQQQQVFVHGECPFCVSPLFMDPSEQPSSGAAQRRKQRRLRSWWRHEQQSIAAALATSLHHSALRGLKKARAGEEDNEMHFTAKTRRTPIPQRELFQLYEEEPGGRRPGSVSDPAPQERVQRHTAVHSADPRCSGAARWEPAGARP